MPRNLWDPMGLPELEDIEQEELAPQPKEVLQQKKRDSWFSRLRAWLYEGQAADAAIQPELPRAVPVTTEISPAAREQVALALQAWKDSEKYFENVSDPELVEFAVYEMEAARRKYMFLLKRAHRMEP